MSFQTHKTFVHLQNTIKMFLIKSESSQTLHRQQHNWNVPRSRNIVNTSVKQFMWHQWLNFSFVTLWEYLFKKIYIFPQPFFSSELSLRPFWRVSQRICTLSPKRKQCSIRRLYSCVCFPPERKPWWLRQIRSWVLSKMAEDVTRGRMIE